ncbi:hypothetical protein pb186bvf_019455 [Paramecium bursaria]
MSFLQQLLKDFKDVQSQVTKDTDHQTILTNNKNKLKLKEFTKKLNLYKQELSNKLNQVELEQTKFKESRIQVAQLVNREINRLQKQDEDTIRDSLAQTKKIIDLNQKFIIEIDNVCDNQTIVSNQELEAASHAFQELESQVQAIKQIQIDISPLDFKILTQNEYFRLLEENKQYQNLKQQYELLQIEIQNKKSNILENQLQTKEREAQAVLKEKLQLQDEVANLLNLSIQAEKENYEFTANQQQQFKNQIKLIQQLEEENRNLKNQLQQMISEIDQITQEKYKLKQVLQQTNIQNKQFEELISQYQQTIQYNQRTLKVQEELEYQNQNLKTLITSIKQDHQDEILSLKQNKDNQIIQLKQHVYSLENKQNDFAESVGMDLKSLDHENQDLRKYIKSKDIEIAQLKQIEQSYRQTVQDLQEIEQKYINLRQNYDNQKLDYLDSQENIFQQYQDKSQQLNQALDQLNEFSKLNSQLELELKEQKLQIQALIQIQENYEQQNNQNQREQEALKDKLRIAEDQISQLQKSLLKEQNINLDLKDKKSDQSYQTQLNLTKERNELQIENNRLQQDIKKLILQLENLNMSNNLQKQTLEQKISKLQNEINDQFKLKECVQSQSEQAYNDLQCEYNQMVEEYQQEIASQEQQNQDLKHKLLLSQRQLEQLELQKQSELLQLKIESEKKHFVTRKELEHVREILESQSQGSNEQYYQQRIQVLQEQQAQIVQQTSLKYENMIQELVQQYEKQINLLADQIQQKTFETQKTRNSQKPPKIIKDIKGSPGVYTNSPVSSQSFYKKVAEFNKELDTSGDEPFKRTGVIKQNKHHIFVEDEHNSTIQSADQTLSAQNYSSMRQQFEQTFNRIEKCVQTEEHAEDVFPPFDHRVCLRCKKNDMIAPNFCKFKEVNDLSQSTTSAQNRKQQRVLKEHVYGSNMSWRQRDSFNNRSVGYNSFQNEKINNSAQTVLQLVNDNPSRKNSKTIMKRHSESLSLSLTSKQESGRSIQ